MTAKNIIKETLRALILYVKIDSIKHRAKKQFLLEIFMGDLETLNKILELYNPIENRLVFLGDYVDRGNKSKEVFDILFELKTLCE